MGISPADGRSAHVGGNRGSIGQIHVRAAEPALSVAEVVQLARWLVQSQLATVEGRLTHKLFVPSPRPRSVPAWLNPAFMRIPLFNPDRLLSRCLPWLGWTLSPWAVLVWFAGLPGRELPNCHPVVAVYGSHRHHPGPQQLALLVAGAGSV